MVKLPVIAERTRSVETQLHSVPVASSWPVKIEWQAKPQAKLQKLHVGGEWGVLGGEWGAFYPSPLSLLILFAVWPFFCVVWISCLWCECFRRFILL